MGVRSVSSRSDQAANFIYEVHLPCNNAGEHSLCQIWNSQNMKCLLLQQYIEYWKCGWILILLIKVDFHITINWIHVETHRRFWNRNSMHAYHFFYTRTTIFKLAKMIMGYFSSSNFGKSPFYLFNFGNRNGTRPGKWSIIDKEWSTLVCQVDRYGIKIPYQRTPFPKI